MRHLTCTDSRDFVNPRAVTLKFWKFSNESRIFVLNTVSNAPHKGNIAAINFRPNSNQFVSAAEMDDNTFKI